MDIPDEPPTLVDAIGRIGRSPLRASLLMALYFEMNARAIASLRLDRMSLEALWIEAARRDGPRLPLPLVVAAFLHEGDRLDHISPDELDRRIRLFDERMSLAETRQRLYATCAVGALRARSLTFGRSATSLAAARRSVARLDIGFLLHMAEPPAALRSTSNTLREVQTAKGAVGRLLLRRLSVVHAWDERDVLAVTGPRNACARLAELR